MLHLEGNNRNRKQGPLSQTPVQIWCGVAVGGGHPEVKVLGLVLASG